MAGGIHDLKEILIVSWNGESGGGAERVTHYARMAWQDRYKITIIDLEMVKSDKKYDIWLGLHYALDALVVSAYTNAYIRKKLKKMFGNSFMSSQTCCICSRP